MACAARFNFSKQTGAADQEGRRRRLNRKMHTNFVVLFRMLDLL